MDGIGYLEIPYKLCKVDNCAIRFKVKSNGPSKLTLISKQCPHEDICKIILGQTSKLVFPDLEPITQHTGYTYPFEYKEFMLRWFGGIYCIGEVNNAPMLEYFDNSIDRPHIGFIKFFTLSDNITSDWIFESPPITLGPPKPIKIKGGELQWLPMTGNVLPLNAMIGGFENEPIYVARAHHRRSLCPGKYVPSKHSAFVAWGHSEHSKDNFEVLCGFDAQWVSCEADNIPENAFVGGTSEVDDQPLYIGRAVVDGKLICGKVHLLYKACFIPSDGREVEKYSYEILVLPRETRAECFSKCYCDV